MIHHEDGTASLEKGERIHVNREIEWVVEHWLPDDDYVGALVFAGQPRTEYMLFPYDNPELRENCVDTVTGGTRND